MVTSIFNIIVSFDVIGVRLLHLGRLQSLSILIIGSCLALQKFMFHFLLHVSYSFWSREKQNRLQNDVCRPRAPGVILTPFDQGVLITWKLLRFPPLNHIYWFLVACVNGYQMVWDFEVALKSLERELPEYVVNRWDPYPYVVDVFLIKNNK